MNRAQEAVRRTEDGAAVGEEQFRKWEIRKTQRDNVDTRGISVHEKGIFRFIQSTFTAIAIIEPVRTIVRGIGENILSYMEAAGRRDIRREVNDGIYSEDNVKRGRGLFAFLVMCLGMGDSFGYRNDWGRNIKETGDVSTDIRHKGLYYRGLPEVLSNEGGNERRAEYVRVEREDGRVFGEVIRRLGIFIKVMAGCMIRDYIIGRFLKSREEVVIKSAVCRELTIESRLH
jgi:hypothetical protein